MRQGLVFAGVAVLVVGLVVFVIALVGAGQAAAAFLSCLNGYPGGPGFGVPAACANAMGALAMYQGLEILGGVLGLIGLVLLVIGIVMQPEPPAPVAMPYYAPAAYAPPAYGPPSGTAPPQGPQTPPPPQP